PSTPAGRRCSNASPIWGTRTTGSSSEELSAGCGTFTCSLGRASSTRSSSITSSGRSTHPGKHPPSRSTTSGRTPVEDQPPLSRYPTSARTVTPSLQRALRMEQAVPQPPLQGARTTGQVQRKRGSQKNAKGDHPWAQARRRGGTVDGAHVRTRRVRERGL